ncbi:MAG: hypothetical protein LBD06_06715 [Candidatus Accumulibacter sp.]|jgi:hypothetical protein|nr:hypothetical protein [Accumulibacter sp.]
MERTSARSFRRYLARYEAEGEAGLPDDGWNMKHRLRRFAPVRGRKPERPVSLSSLTAVFR